MKSHLAQISSESQAVSTNNLRARRTALVAEPGPIWAGRPANAGALTTDDLLHAPVAKAAELTNQLETALITAMKQRPQTGESHLEASVRREGEILQIFAELNAGQRCHLRKRLDCNHQSDTLAAAFRRMVVERRQRLYSALSRHR